MAGRCLGVLGHKGLELRLGILMLEVSLAGAPKPAREFRPGIGRAHVDDPSRLDARSRRLDIKQVRGLAALDATPEFLLRGPRSCSYLCVLFLIGRRVRKLDSKIDDEIRMSLGR